MHNNNYQNTYYNNQRRQPGQMAAFLLGMGPLPPPQPQDVAVALANHMLDHPDNIDPQLCTPEIGMLLTCILLDDADRFYRPCCCLHAGE